MQKKESLHVGFLLLNVIFSHDFRYIRNVNDWQDFINKNFIIYFSHGNNTENRVFQWSCHISLLTVVSMLGVHVQQVTDFSQLSLQFQPLYNHLYILFLWDRFVKITHWWQYVFAYFWYFVSCPLFLLTGHCFPIQLCFSLSQNLVGFSCQLSVIPIAWMFRQAMLPVFFWEKLYDIRYSKERSIQIPLLLRKHSGFSTSGSIFSEEKLHYK